MPWEGPAAPYRIETERLVIRCYETTDAPLLKDAIDSSLEHLRPFSAWIDDEPQTIEQKVELIQSFRIAFDTAEAFVYGIFEVDERQQLGGAGLHARVGLGGLEIVYSCARARRVGASQRRLPQRSRASGSRCARRTA
jgi:hypothetical protein